VVAALDFCIIPMTTTSMVRDCRNTVRAVAHVVGIGGSTRSESSTERMLAAVLRKVEERGATTTLLAGVEIELPTYAPERSERTRAAQRLVAEVERADGIVIASPGYHGGISGMVKNALDYLEDLRDAPRPYLTVKTSERSIGLNGTVESPELAARIDAMADQVLSLVPVAAAR
jgi:FMN reductase